MIDRTDHLIDLVRRLLPDVPAERGLTALLTDAEKALAELVISEARYRTVGETIPFGVWFADADGYFRYVSQAFLDVVGMPLEQLQHFGWTHLLPSEDQEATAALWRHCIETGEHWEKLHRFQDRSGVYRHVLSLGRPVRDSEGAITSWVGLNLDIAERVEAEQKLQTQARIFDAALSSIVDFAYIFGRDGRFLYANQALLNLWGRTLEQAVGKNFYELNYPPELAEKLQRQIRQVFDTGQRLTDETPYTSPSGAVGFYEYIFAPVLTPEGLVEAVAGSTRDITAHKRAGATFARDAMLLANVRDAVIVTDVEGVVTFWNLGATKLLGWEAGEMIGRSLVERVPPEARDGYTEAVRQIVAGQPYHGEWLDYRKDGSRVWIEAHVERVLDADGNLSGVMGLSHDITDRKKAEQELRDAKEAAEAANEAKTRFLACLSHELRTPLSPVLAAAALLSDDPSLSCEVKADIEMIRRNVELEGRIIDDLLDISRIATGKLQLSPEDVDCHDLIGRVTAICGPDIVAKKLVLDLRLGARRALVRGDPARLQQILWNLLKNSTKFCPETGSITITTSIHDDQRLRVEVADTGIGIEPHLISKLFDAFEQGSAAVTRQFGGLGLGLSISKTLADAHGGTLTAASDGVNRGATFTLELPLLTVATSEAGSTVKPHQAGDNQRPLAGGSILVVEDHDDSRKMLVRLLRKLGHRVEAAASVADAMIAAGNHRFDVAISDIGLPDGSGLDLMRKLRLEHGLKAIALSGYGMEEDLHLSDDAGCVAHLTKPVSLNALEKVLREVLP